MKLIEYRIMLPLSVEENQIGQLWSFAEVSRLNTGGGEGVEILENVLFDIPFEGDSNKISLEDLPDYEDYETQKNSNSSSKNSSNNLLKPQRTVKKSSSKENFAAAAAQQVPRRESTLSERSKSLDHTLAALAASSSHHHAEITKSHLEHPVHGQYTHKFYILDSKIPWFVRKLIPRDSTKLHERSWNMYPTVKTVLTNEYFRTNFRIEIDTVVRACPNGEPEFNVHSLTPEQLEKREIVNIDISEPIAECDYKPDEDPTRVRSVKTGRGPLVQNNWVKTCIAAQQPVICCYKLVFLEFKMFGVQSKCESYLRNMYRQLFTIFHRQIYCWLDKWHGMTMEDVRKIEYELAKDLVKQIGQGEVSKTQLVNNKDGNNNGNNNNTNE